MVQFLITPVVPFKHDIERTSFFPKDRCKCSPSFVPDYGGRSRLQLLQRWRSTAADDKRRCFVGHRAASGVAARPSPGYVSGERRRGVRPLAEFCRRLCAIYLLQFLCHHNFICTVLKKNNQICKSDITFPVNTYTLLNII